MAAQIPAPTSPGEPGRPPDAGKPVLAPPPPRIQMSWPKRVFAAAFVLAIAAIVVASLRPRAEPPLAIQAATARKGPITRLVTAA
jgi:HlyD family secretion protein